MTQAQHQAQQIDDLIGRARVLREQYAPQLAWISRELSQNFDAPAQRIINAGFNRIGQNRFTRAGDDLWEMITALENDWEYQRPARHLVDRWATA
jgi:hypothetical protein